MGYVALSRCRDLSKVQLVGKLNLEEKGWLPNGWALEFWNSGKTASADQLLFIPDSKKQLKNVKRHSWKEPNWNHIYIDFETANDEFK